jgi:hypothetical protein
METTFYEMRFLPQMKRQMNTDELNWQGGDFLPQPNEAFDQSK